MTLLEAIATIQKFRATCTQFCDDNSDDPYAFARWIATMKHSEMAELQAENAEAWGVILAFNETDKVKVDADAVDAKALLVVETAKREAAKVSLK